MKRSTLLIIGLLASLAAEAQIYQYKDASGKTVISDRPPPASVKSKTIAAEAAATAQAPATTTPAATQKTAADSDLDFKKRQQERQEKAAKEKQEIIAAAQRKEQCSRARGQLQMLESGERVAGQDEKGERVYMDDAQRAQEIERTRKIIADTCK